MKVTAKPLEERIPGSDVICVGKKYSPVFGPELCVEDCIRPPGDQYATREKEDCPLLPSAKVALLHLFLMHGAACNLKGVWFEQLLIKRDCNSHSACALRKDIDAHQVQEEKEVWPALGDAIMLSDSPLLRFE
jgi:hypothetical protein